MRIILFLISFSLLFACSVSKPVKEDFVLDECRRFYMCMYYNQKNPDKAVCLPFAQECRAASRFERCQKMYGNIDTKEFYQCLNLLNQK